MAQGIATQSGKQYPGRLPVAALRAWLGALLVLLGTASAPGCADRNALAGDVFALDDGLELSEQSSAQTAISAILERSTGDSEHAPVVIDYPLEASVFPPEIVAPTFLWHDAEQASRLWLVDVAFDQTPYHIYVLTSGDRPQPEIDYRCVTENNAYRETEYQASARAWRPSDELWSLIKQHSVESEATVTIAGVTGTAARLDEATIVSRGTVTIRTSRDAVGATIFYRDVPLMPTQTREGVIQPLDKSMFPLIQWRLRDISQPRAPVVMQHLPTCANCHSFSADGATLAMDMDGPGGDKGAYVVKEISPRMVIEKDDVFSWNSFPERPEDMTTFGLFARISPDGRYVVTTLNEEIFVTNFSDILFQQTFYPTRGILVWYDRTTGEIRRLPGADDPEYVQANPVWSPDGKTIVFLRAKARPAYSEGPRPTHANDPRETQMRFDLYRIPFNDGKGGIAEPLRGASRNGMSNSFPKFSPDGRWIVFVQARNGMLLRPDSKLYIVPAAGGEARLMNCNTERMNSWHSWSPNSRWLVFSSKQNRPFTQMFLTHIDENGNDTPPILIPDSTADNRAVNLPEFVRLSADELLEITTPAVDYRRHLDRARELREAGQNEQAVAELETSLELKSDYWETHLTYADLLAREGKPADAIEHYRQALELNPRYFYTLNNLGVALSRVGRHQEAVEHFNVALEINPGSPMTHYSLGRALSLDGQLERAAAHFAAAVEIDPRLDDAHFEWGRMLMRGGAPAEAIEHFARAVEINPQHFAAHHEWGLALARSRRAAEAVEHYRQSIEINAEYYPAYDSLARVLAAHADTSLRDGGEAVRLAELACRRTGFANERYLHTLAVAYAEVGRYEDAVRTAEKALDLAQGNQRSRLVREIDSHLRMFRAKRPVRIGG